MRRPRLPRLPKRIVGLVEDLRRKEDRLSLALSLFIGALVGLVVVAFILLTGRLAAHMYPAGGLGWRRILVPTLGSLLTGYLLYRYFPLARGSGIPQTRAAVFILEEIMGDLHAPVLGSVVLASATAWIVLHLVLGDSPLFHVAGYNLVSPGELLIYALLGVIGGLASVAFVKLLLKLRERFLRFP